MTGSRVTTALAYAACSVLIMLVNKIILFSWGFPSASVLALSQFVFTFSSLWLLRKLCLVDFPPLTRQAVRHAFPLPLLFLGNAVTGLSGTGALSLPMFTVLRRSNIVMTMALEYWLLNYRYSWAIVASVSFVMAGSVVAAMFDLHFEFRGYTVVLVNNVMTSLSGVVGKMKLGGTEKTTLGVFGLMYVNSIVAAPLLTLYLLLVDPEHNLARCVEFPYWLEWKFIGLFLLSSLMGTLLQLSIFYCTKVNSALTTVVVGVFKNVITSYVGMLPLLGYSFDLANFAGINMSAIGGCVYAYVQFTEMRKSARDEGDVESVMSGR